MAGAKVTEEMGSENDGAILAAISKVVVQQTTQSFTAPDLTLEFAGPPCKIRSPTSVTPFSTS